MGLLTLTLLLLVTLSQSQTCGAPSIVTIFLYSCTCRKHVVGKKNLRCLASSTHYTCNLATSCSTPPATWNGADVAVKVIVHTNAMLATKISAEVELSMMLRHPNIVATYHAITRHSSSLRSDSVWESVGQRSSGLATTPSLPMSRKAAHEGP